MKLAYMPNCRILWYSFIIQFIPFMLILFFYIYCIDIILMQHNNTGNAEELFKVGKNTRNFQARRSNCHVSTRYNTNNFRPEYSSYNRMKTIQNYIQQFSSQHIQQNHFSLAIHTKCILCYFYCLNVEHVFANSCITFAQPLQQANSNLSY